jgi:hypothetical protein
MNIRIAVSSVVTSCNVVDSYGLEEHNQLHLHRMEKLKMQAAIT